MNRSQLSEIVNPALRTFFKRDRYLLENDVSELSITHKLATYIERHLRKQKKRWGDNIPNYVVDCEFNRERDDVKRLPYTHYLSKEREHLYAPCPDIVVHERGTNDYNAVVIEVKKMNGYFRPFLRALDLLKLSCFMQAPLGYEFGVFLMFDTAPPYRIREAIMLSKEDQIRVDGKLRSQFQNEMASVWTKWRYKNQDKRREIEEMAIALSEQIDFENVVDESCTALAVAG